jgi:hypothetical protein
MLRTAKHSKNEAVVPEEEVYSSTENDVSITENDKNITYKKSSNKDKDGSIMEVCNTPAVNYGQYYIKNGWK